MVVNFDRSDDFLVLPPLQEKRFRDLSEGVAPRAYARPESKTFATFDSFTTDSEDLIAFQITVNQQHGLKSSGISKILQFRERFQDSAINNPLRVYFVVPPDLYPIYNLQSITYTDKKDTGLESKIEQYALKMPWHNIIMNDSEYNFIVYFLQMERKLSSQIQSYSQRSQPGKLWCSDVCTHWLCKWLFLPLP